MTEKDKQSKSSTPEKYPVTSPGVPGTGEHTGLILTTVMQLQHSVGALENSVEMLRSRVDEQGTKLDHISHQISNARTVLIVVAIAISGALSFVAFLANKFADVAIKHWGG